MFETGENKAHPTVSTIPDKMVKINPDNIHHEAEVVVFGKRVKRGSQEYKDYIATVYSSPKVSDLWREDYEGRFN